MSPEWSCPVPLGVGLGPHSTDRVAVYHGELKPTEMCGQHAQYVNESLKAIRREKANA